MSRMLDEAGNNRRGSPIAPDLRDRNLSRLPDRAQLIIATPAGRLISRRIARVVEARSLRVPRVLRPEKPSRAEKYTSGMLGEVGPSRTVIRAKFTRAVVIRRDYPVASYMVGNRGAGHVCFAPLPARSRSELAPRFSRLSRGKTEPRRKISAGSAEREIERSPCTASRAESTRAIVIRRDYSVAIHTASNRDAGHVRFRAAFRSKPKRDRSAFSVSLARENRVAWKNIYRECRTR